MCLRLGAAALVGENGGSRPCKEAHDVLHPDPSSQTPRQRPAPVEVPLDAERLDAYQVALSLQVEVAALAERCDAVVRDQLRRASLSALLNLAEGAGRRAASQKRYHYGLSRGSASECAAILDVIRVRQLAPRVDCLRARALVARIVQMVTKLEQSLE